VRLKHDDIITYLCNVRFGLYDHLGKLFCLLLMVVTILSTKLCAMTIVCCDHGRVHNSVPKCKNLGMLQRKATDVRE
jgi:hypothetical protein